MALTILYRIIALLIGYLCGLFTTGYFLGKSKGVDIQSQGSGSVGATNTTRVLGHRSGVLTFIGDFCKTIVAVGLTWLLFRHLWEDGIRLLMLYAGFGTVLGHSFPVHLHFKGGKGIVCMTALAFLTVPAVLPLCIVIFLTALLISRHVSVGSIAAVVTFWVQVLLFAFLDGLGMDAAVRAEFIVICTLVSLLAVWRHRSNLKRLQEGTENSIDNDATADKAKQGSEK